MGLLKNKTKKTKFGTKISMPTFDISVFFRGFLLTSCDFRKSDKLGHLERNGFGKPPCCTSKLCNNLFWGLTGKREIKGLFLKIL